MIAHRGAPHSAIENTLASFRAAASEGARAIELDARLTRDGVVVVHHDAELGRVVPGRGLVEELDAAALPAEVASLADVLSTFDGLVDVELKSDASNARALPHAAYDVVRELGALDRVLVTSFEGDLAAAYADVSGRDVGLIAPFPILPEDVAFWPSVRHVMMAREAAEPEALAPLLDAGYRVHVWTVNDADEARALLERGASSIITDRPGALLRSLRA